MKVISSGRQERVAGIEQPAGVAPTVQGQAVSIGPAVEVDPVIWTAKLRTGRVVTFRASDSRAFRAAILIVPVAVGLAAIAPVEAALEDLAAVATDSVAAVLDALADSAAAAAGSGADVNN